MSGSSPGGPNAATSAAGAADPSMEDILASIRRILSEDETAPAPAPPAAPPPAPPPAAEAPEPDDDVFSLDSSMLVEDVPVPPPPLPPVAIPEVPAAVAAPPAAPPPMPAESFYAPADGLLGAAAAAAASSSLGALVRTLAERQNVAVYRGGPTLEDLVRDEMRPILKAWLDTNLPPLVERLVRAEIERVVGRAVS